MTESESERTESETSDSSAEAEQESPTSADFAGLLGELKQSGEAFKREAESLNDTLTGVERSLRDLALDVEVWLEDNPLRIQELSVSASIVAPHIEVQIGFAPSSHGGWRLQLRKAEYAHHMDIADDPQRRLMRVLEQMPLIDASKDDRTAALQHLGALIRAMTKATNRRTEALRQGRKLADDSSS